MTLFKQIALFMSTLLLLLLSTVLVLNFINTSRSIQEQLYEDAKNTASSLSLSLGTAEGDESIMATMINANFDSGHYRRIALYGIDEALVYERLQEERSVDVPVWFTNMIHIDIPTATAQVSSGWSPIGILSVQSDNAYAYEFLYSSLIGLVILFASLYILGLLLLYSVLRVVLTPLRNVQRQAEAILNNEFIIQEQLPYTTEFKNVVKGMNAMTGKVKDIFEKGNKAIQHNRQLLYNDSVSGLYNRRYMIMKFPEYLGEEASYDYGSIIMLTLHGAQEANQKLGRLKTDELFASLGDALMQHGAQYKERIAARLNGTEFALILPGCDSKNGCSLGESLCMDTTKILQRYDLLDDMFGINAGVYRYNRKQPIGEILANADYAMSQSNLLSHCKIYYHGTHDIDTTMGKEAWRQLITDALSKDRFELSFWPVYDTGNETLHHHVTTFHLHDMDGTDYSFGQFIAPVISLGMESTVYTHIIENLLKSRKTAESAYRCAVRLSSNFLHTPNLTADLTALFEHYAPTHAGNIIFELPDALTAENLDLVIQFTALFRRYGFEFGINQFNAASRDYSFLQELKPAYIKANAAFLMDQSPQSMSTLQIVTDTLGIELIAESVTEQSQLDRLKENGIHTIQGPLAETYL